MIRKKKKGGSQASPFYCALHPSMVTVAMPMWSAPMMMVSRTAIDVKAGHIRPVHDHRGRGVIDYDPRRWIIGLVDHRRRRNAVRPEEKAKRGIHAPSHRYSWPHNDQHGQTHHQSNHRFSHRRISFPFHFVFLSVEFATSCSVFKAIGIPKSEMMARAEEILFKYLISHTIFIIRRALFWGNGIHSIPRGSQLCWRISGP